MWEVWKGIYQKAFSDEEWLQVQAEWLKGGERFYLNDHGVSVERGSDLQVQKIKWELWEIHKATA